MSAPLHSLGALPVVLPSPERCPREGSSQHSAAAPAPPGSSWALWGLDLGPDFLQTVCGKA